MPSVSLFLRRAGALVRLLRPLNFGMFTLGVLLGGWMAGGTAAFEAEARWHLLTAAVSAALIGGAANSLNDACDVEIDRINRPDRPLPAGMVSPRAAKLLWGGCSALGVALSGWLSVLHVVLATASVLLLGWYNLRLKRTVLWGNLVVALVVALAIVYGGMAVGDGLPALTGAAFAFLTTLAREVVKDAEDVAGDAAAGARTLPVVAGLPLALRLATAVLLLTVALTPLPYLFLGYSGLFLLGLLVADGLLLGVVLRLHPEPARLHQASGLLKGAMLAGMAALAAA